VALPELLEALRTQAAERRAEELARADAEVERIRADSQATLAKRKGERMDRVVHDANESARRSLSEARAQSARSILEARDRLLRRVRTALDTRTRARPSHLDRHAVWANELASALERLPEGRVIVRARPELVDALTEAVGDGRGVVVEMDAGMGAGFVAVAPEAGMEIDATLDAMLRHRWPHIAVAVLAELGP
jgi:vacuolar-type H+-ATPase subunit E/Vma4